jgi:hypothetical protein
MRAGDVQIVADVGPFGEGSGGHSHSDTLSILVRAGDEEVLIDPGTYTYISDPQWRNWFRGSSAHNTVRIDGLDQATPAGPFRWHDHPRIRILGWKSSAEQDELDALCEYFGFRHRRRLVFQKPHTLSILDEIEGGSSGPHIVEQFWHPGSDGSRLTLDSRFDVRQIEGWRSRVLGSKEPANVVCVRYEGTLPVRLETTLDLSR